MSFGEQQKRCDVRRLTCFVTWFIRIARPRWSSDGKHDCCARGPGSDSRVGQSYIGFFHRNFSVAGTGSEFVPGWWHQAQRPIDAVSGRLTAALRIVGSISTRKKYLYSPKLVVPPKEKSFCYVFVFVALRCISLQSKTRSYSQYFLVESQKFEIQTKICQRNVSNKSPSKHPEVTNNFLSRR